MQLCVKCLSFIINALVVQSKYVNKGDHTNRGEGEEEGEGKRGEEEKDEVERQHLQQSFILTLDLIEIFT
jgi:hypothetical protein